MLCFFFYFILFFLMHCILADVKGSSSSVGFSLGWKAVNVESIHLTASMETSVWGHLIFGLSPELHPLIISLLFSNNSTGFLSNFTQTLKSCSTHSRLSVYTYVHCKTGVKLASVHYQPKKTKQLILDYIGLHLRSLISSCAFPFCPIRTRTAGGDTTVVDYYSLFD